MKRNASRSDGVKLVCFIIAFVTELALYHEGLLKDITFYGGLEALWAL